MSFGFSVGDFITAGTIVAETVSCLREAGGSRSEYQELLRELDILQLALTHLSKLETTHFSNHSISAQLHNIRCAALACRVPLEEFLGKIQKYEISLGLRSPDGRKIKNAARKIEWAFGKKEEVRKLQIYLSIHIGSINMMLVEYELEVLQLASKQAASDKQDTHAHIERLRAAIVDTAATLSEAKTEMVSQSVAIRHNTSLLEKVLGGFQVDLAAPLKRMIEMIGGVQ